MFDTVEISTHDGAPIELYEFRAGARVFRYTSAAEDLTVNSTAYQSASIARSAIEGSTDVARNNLTITAQRDLAVADLFRVAPPSSVVTVTVLGLHATDADAETVVLWQGRVLNVKWQGIEARLHAEPIFTSLQRPGLRLMYQRQCPHRLYGPGCRVNRGSFELITTLNGVAGTVLTVNDAQALGDGWFAGGMITVEITPGTPERRFLTGHIGSQVTMNLGIPNLAAGQVATLLPGCDHTPSTCNDKFGNIENYGGWPFMPTKNPFGSDPVY